MEEISRFIDAQHKFIKIAKKELRKGKKQSHWIWFVFPQLKGLGTSIISFYYGLEGSAETKQYFDNDYLRKNLIDCFKIILRYKNYEKVLLCFGSLDAKKIKSCATLFYIVTKEEIFKKALDKFFDGSLDEQTMVLLGMR